MKQIYLPDRGMIYWDVYLADKAAKEYDDRLKFDFNPSNGQYTIYIHQPRGWDPEWLPVLGFGFEVPDPEEVRKRLYWSDSMRHGDKILKRIDDHNDAIKKAKAWQNDQAVGDKVEHLEHAMRKEGLSPVIKSLPKGR